MKIMLVVPRYVERVNSYYQFPLGLGYIASAVKYAGHSVVCLNLNEIEEERIDSSLANILGVERPEILATGGLSGWASQVAHIFRLAKELAPNIKTVVGGGMLGGEPEPVMRSTCADFGVIGEGEATIVELLNSLENGAGPAGIEGLIYRCVDSDRLIRTKPRAALADLNFLPWPDYELLGYPSTLRQQTPTDSYAFFRHSKPRAIDMVTSRSCPFSCTFCFHPAGKVYRERDLDAFMMELTEYKCRYDINTVMVVDELFSLRRDRLLDFCKKIRPLDVSWVVQLHVHSVDSETLGEMRSSGCVAISYGIESMDQTILSSMKKKSKVERIHTALQLTAQSGIAIQGNLIFGDAAETVETANNSLKWWLVNRRWSGVYVNMLEVWPGSPIYINAVRDGVITDRDHFVNSLPIVTNISSMATQNHNFLRSLVGIYTFTGFSLARKQKILESASIIEGRGTAWDIHFECPHCSTSQTIDSCIIEETYNPLIRLHCIDCSLRVDFDNPNIPLATDAEIEQARKIICDAENSSLPEEEFKLDVSAIQHILESRHPDVAKAAMLTGKQLLSTEDIVGAFFVYKLALRTNHSDIPLLLSIAKSLLDLKIGGGSRVVCERILEFDHCNIEAHDILRMLGNMPAAHRDRMIISISDDPPPARKHQDKKHIKITHRDKLKLSDGRFDIEPEFTHLEPA